MSRNFSIGKFNNYCEKRGITFDDKGEMNNG